MNDLTTPWDEIATPISSLNVRKCDSYKTGDICWAKNSLNVRMFVINLEGDQRDVYNDHYIKVRGVETDLRFCNEAGRQRLLISLESAVDGDIFYDFCCTLRDTVKTAQNSAGAVFLCFQHIRRWKNFLSGARHILSPQKIRGLVGELLFFEQLLHAGYEAPKVIEAWAGPEGGNQDFIIDDAAIEIKIISGLEHNKIRISSEDQLETVRTNLYLKIFRFIEADKSDDSFSLYSLVDTLTRKINQTNPCYDFHNRLSSAGYTPMLYYDKLFFKGPEQSTFEVTDDFPKLVRLALPIDISNVLYDLSLDSIAAFKCVDIITFKE